MSKSFTDEELNKLILEKYPDSFFAQRMEIEKAIIELGKAIEGSLKPVFDAIKITIKNFKKE